MPDDPKPDTMRLRFRRDHAIGPTTYQAGKHETVEITDEAWQAVNVGAADLDPPPGVSGQPRPEDIPDWVTQSPAPEPVLMAPAAAPGVTPVAPTRAAVPADRGRSGKAVTPEMKTPPEPNRLDRGDHDAPKKV